MTLEEFKIKVFGLKKQRHPLKTILLKDNMIKQKVC